MNRNSCDFRRTFVEVRQDAHGLGFDGCALRSEEIEDVDQRGVEQLTELVVLAHADAKPALHVVWCVHSVEDVRRRATAGQAAYSAALRRSSSAASVMMCCDASRLSPKKASASLVTLCRVCRVNVHVEFTAA